MTVTVIKNKPRWGREGKRMCQEINSRKMGMIRTRKRLHDPISGHYDKCTIIRGDGHLNWVDPIPRYFHDIRKVVISSRNSENNDVKTLYRIYNK